MVRVLFVCLGNICRSPMAEAIFRKLVSEEILSDEIEVDSAGTSNWHIGKVPHEGTRNILSKHNISDEEIHGRQIEQADFSNFTYIIAMDDQNIKDLLSEFKYDDRIIVKKLLDFVSERKEKNVPDPYYTGDFDYTFKLLLEACQKLLTHIKENDLIQQKER